MPGLEFDFEGDFSALSVYQTKSIALNIGETIVNARIVLDTDALSNAADFTWELTADGGTNWESVSLNTQHTFTNTGNDLRMRAVASVGAYIKIRQDDGEDLVIKVLYNE